MLKAIKYTVLAFGLLSGSCCSMGVDDYEQPQVVLGYEQGACSCELMAEIQVHKLFQALVNGTIRGKNFVAGLKSIPGVFKKEELQQEVVCLLFHYFFFHRPFNVAKACDTVDFIFSKIPSLMIFIDRKVKDAEVSGQVIHFYTTLLPHKKMIMAAFLTHYALGKVVKEFDYTPYYFGGVPQFLNFNALVDLVICTRIDAAIYKNSALLFSFYDFYRSASLSSAIPSFACAEMVEGFLSRGIVSCFNHKTMKIVRAIFMDDLESVKAKDHLLYQPPIHLPVSVVELAALAGAEEIVSYYQDDILCVQDEFRLRAIQGGNRSIIEHFGGIKTEQEVAQAIRHGMNKFFDLDVIGETYSYELLMRYALQYNNVPLFFLCLQHGVNPLSSTIMKYPFHYAAQKNFLTLLFYYTTCFKDNVINDQLKIKLIDQVDIYGLSAVGWACKGDFYYAIKMLIENGAAVNQIEDAENEVAHINVLKRSPLEIAISRNRPSIVELLLKYGASVSVCKDGLYCNLLHQAAARCSPPVVASLIDAGASPYDIDRYGKRPYYYACKRNRSDLYPYLVTV